MADIFEKPTKVLWLKGPNKGQFDWMKMRFIKEWLRKDRDALVLASKTPDIKDTRKKWRLSYEGKGESLGKKFEYEVSDWTLRKMTNELNKLHIKYKVEKI